MEKQVLSLSEFITHQLKTNLWFVWNETGDRPIHEWEVALTAEQYATFQRRYNHIYGCPICKGARQ